MTQMISNGIPGDEELTFLIEPLDTVSGKFKAGILRAKNGKGFLTLTPGYQYHNHESLADIKVLHAARKSVEALAKALGKAEKELVGANFSKKVRSAKRKSDG